MLPPLRDVKIRPEIGSTVRNKLVRLMTHVDMGVKQTAAEFLFVLCKESGEDTTAAHRDPELSTPAVSGLTLSVVLCCSGQPAEVHGLRQRRGAPGGPGAPGRRQRRDSVL